MAVSIDAIAAQMCAHEPALRDETPVLRRHVSGAVRRAVQMLHWQTSGDAVVAWRGPTRKAPAALIANGAGGAALVAAAGTFLELIAQHPREAELAWAGSRAGVYRLRHRFQ